MAPRIEINPAPFVPARFGLLSAASLVTEEDVHWRNEVFTLPTECGPATSYADDCPGVADRLKVINDGVEVRGGQPFTVYAGFRCSPVGFTPEEIATRAAAALANGEARAVEAVLWSGDTDNGEVVQPFLGNTNAAAGLDFTPPVVTEVTTGPTNFADALGLLEDAVASCYGGVPIIHGSRAYSGYLSDAGITRQGQSLETILGSKFAAGAGYEPGTLYATGAVQVIRSAPEVVGSFRDSIDRAVNTVTYIVERTYVVTWDCCLFSAEVTPLEDGA